MLSSSLYQYNRNLWRLTKMSKKTVKPLPANPRGPECQTSMKNKVTRLSPASQPAFAMMWLISKESARIDSAYVVFPAMAKMNIPSDIPLHFVWKFLTRKSIEDRNHDVVQSGMLTDLRNSSPNFDVAFSAQVQFAANG